MNNIVPPINSRGCFKFKEPFDQYIDSDKEYTVSSVRSLTELYSSEEEPLDTIYRAVGMTESDYADDVKNKVPIVIFVTDGGEFFYVPANRILSLPQLYGTRYQEFTVAIPLGQLPVSYDYTLLQSTLKDIVYEVIGVQTDVSVIKTSNVILVPDAEHTMFQALLKNKKSVDKSYMTKYRELLVINERQKALIEELEKCPNCNTTTPL